MVLEKVRHMKHGAVVVHMDMKKEEVADMIDSAVEDIKAHCIPKDAVVNMVKRIQIDVLHMQSDRMSGDDDLIRRNEMIDILGKYIKEVRGE